MDQMYSQGDGMISHGEFLKKSHDIALNRRKLTNNKNINYYNIPAAFDIETSSFYQGEKKSENKRAVMYVWQFGMDNNVTYGRTWEEFLSLISVLKKAMGLDKDNRLVVYVHNLPYEFQFIRKRIKWDEVFQLQKRKPVYALTTDGIEFRCSLKLAGGKSLENVAKDLKKYPVQKMVGYLDYNKIRTPITPLTRKELLYCENDIRVLLSFIQEKIEQDGDITRIPLTNTGYVREYCRKKCYKRWKKYRKIISNLTIEPDEYSQLKRAFQGGFTHANHNYTNKILEKVSSYDFGSSYPAVMVLDKFPMSTAIKINGKIEFKELKEILLRYCCLFDVEFYELEPIRYQDHPISRYKCKNIINGRYDNGRVILAEYLKTTVTEQDFFTYLQFYKFSKINISNMRIYEKNYLPTPFVKSILSLYESKTKLKGNVEEEINYNISKNMINAGYGMMVTDPVRDEEIYTPENTFEKNERDIEISIEKYNKNIRRFLYYPWGIWVTAYARANLFSGIISLGEDYVYSDTDSVKLLNVSNHKEYFERYNRVIIEKIKKASQYHGIPIEMFSPKTRNGIEKPIGLWEYEGEYNRFKTLGAKRYLTSKFVVGNEFEDNGILVQLTELEHTLTLAGANKKRAMSYLRQTKKPFESFRDGLRIPNTHSGRLTLTFIDDEIEGDIVDMYGVPYHYHELSCIHMEPSEYHLSITEEYIRYIEGIEDFSE